MLFLYRPRQTRMPFARPQSRTQQATYNRRLQASSSRPAGSRSRARGRRARLRAITAARRAPQVRRSHRRRVRGGKAKLCRNDLERGRAATLVRPARRHRGDRRPLEESYTDDVRAWTAGLSTGRDRVDGRARPPRRRLLGHESSRPPRRRRRLRGGRVVGGDDPNRNGRPAGDTRIERTGIRSSCTA